MTAISAIQDILNRVTVDGENLITVDLRHQKTHDKKSFVAHFENTVTNIGEMTVIAFNVPAAIVAHMLFTVQSTHNTDVFLYRDTSIDVDEGTQLAITNRNQLAPLGTSLITSIETAPVANKMTSFNETQAASANITTTSELDNVVLIGGDGPLAIGAQAQGWNEWNFGDDVQFAIVMSALTADDADHLIRIDYYEEDA